MKIFAFLLLAIFAAVSVAVDYNDPVCFLTPFVRGHCRAGHTSYSYNPEINECVEFIYGGCGGNGNRFRTKEICESTCKE